MPGKEAVNIKPYRILIIRFSSIGDIVLTTPLVRALKNMHSNTVIDYLTLADYSILLRDNPVIDNLYAIERDKGLMSSVKYALSLNKNRYDYILDLHHSTRSLVFRSLVRAKKKTVLKKNYIKRFLLISFRLNLYKKPFTVVKRYFDSAKYLGINDYPGAEIWITSESLQSALSNINRAGGTEYKLRSGIKNKQVRIERGIIKGAGKAVALMPFAKWKTKEWGDERFIALGRKLVSENNVLVQIIGGPGDIPRAERIAAGIGKGSVSLAGKLGLMETALVLSASDCLVTNDTGVMHIGGAVSIPVIAVFGSTTEELGFFPYNTKGEVIQAAADCRPCTAKGLTQCPKKHFKCMNNITTDMVYSCVINLL